MAQPAAAAEANGDTHSDEEGTAWKLGPGNTHVVLSGFNNLGLIEVIWIWE